MSSILESFVTIDELSALGGDLTTEVEANLAIEVGSFSDTVVVDVEVENFDLSSAFDDIDYPTAEVKMSELIEAIVTHVGDSKVDVMLVLGELAKQFADAT